MRRLVFDLVAGAALAAMFALAWAICEGAPVPPPKPPPKRPGLAGEWIALWNNQSDWFTVLSDNGAYTADRPAGPRYEGSWSLKGDTISIDERHAGPDASMVYSHSFKLAPGKLESVCGRFRLRKRP
jgi:hypothetical protein